MTTTLSETPRPETSKAVKTTLAIEMEGVPSTEVLGDAPTSSAKMRARRRGLEAAEVTLIAQAATLDVKDADSYLEATQLVTALKRLESRLETWYEGFLRPVRAIGTVIRAWKTIDVDQVEQARTALDRKAIAWKREQDAREARERRAREAEARRIAEAERLAKINELRQTAKAETNVDLRKALNQEAALVAQTPVATAAVTVERRVPKTPGYSTRKYYSAALDDDAGGLAALVKAVAAGEEPLDMLCLNQTAANQRATDQKDEFRLTGCKLITREGSASR